MEGEEPSSPLLGWASVLWPDLGTKGAHQGPGHLPAALSRPLGTWVHLRLPFSCCDSKTEH